MSTKKDPVTIVPAAALTPYAQDSTPTSDPMSDFFKFLPRRDDFWLRAEDFFADEDAFRAFVNAGTPLEKDGLRFCFKDSASGGHGNLSVFDVASGKLFSTVWCNYSGSWFFGSFCREFVRLSRLVWEYRFETYCGAYIRSGKQSIETSFLQMGAVLVVLAKQKIGNEIYDYAQAEFGFSKTTVKNLIGVVQRFCQKSDVGFLPQLVDSFKTETFSTLVELLPLPDEKVQTLLGKTVKEIRDEKKKLKGDSGNKVVSGVLETKAVNNEPPAQAAGDIHYNFASFQTFERDELAFILVSIANGMSFELALAQHYRRNPSSRAG
jgi:hypothetical protein